VSDASRHDNDESEGLVLTFEELAEAIKHAPPPTDDDVSITWDGRAINSKEKLLAVLQEVEANRKAGVTFEELRQRPGAWGKNGDWTVDWDWDPVTDPGPDLAWVVEVLDRHGVEYLIVGGHAARA
jgi:hypothetical protein